MSKKELTDRINGVCKRRHQFYKAKKVAFVVVRSGPHHYEILFDLYEIEPKGCNMEMAQRFFRKDILKAFEKGDYTLFYCTYNDFYRNLYMEVRYSRDKR